MKRLSLISLVAVGALILSGCTSQPGDPTEAEEVPQGTSVPTEITEPDVTADSNSDFDGRDVRSQDFDIDHERAVELALEAASGGFVFYLELDYSSDHGMWKYEVEVLDGTTEHDIEINAMTGEVLDHDTDSEDDNEREITFEMTPAEALDLASAELSENAIIEGWKLEWDDGRLEYEIDVEPGRDVIVDVETGEVRPD